MRSKRIKLPQGVSLPEIDATTLVNATPNVVRDANAKRSRVYFSFLKRRKISQATPTVTRIAITIKIVEVSVIKCTSGSNSPSLNRRF